MGKQIKEFRKLTDSEIKNRIKELRKELMKEKAPLASGSTTSNSGRIREKRKNIARLLTVLKERVLKELKEKKEVKKDHD